MNEARRWCAALCGFGYGLLLLSTRCPADVTYVAQSRSVSAQAFDVGPSSANTASSPDFTPFAGTVSASAPVPEQSAACTAGASQISRLYPSGIAFSGSAGGADTDPDNDGSGYGSGLSVVDVTFTVSAATPFAFTLSGFDYQVSNPSFAGVDISAALTASNGATVFSGSLYFSTTPYTASGTLAPGTYHFVAQLSAGGGGTGTSSASGSFSGALQIPPCNPPSITSAPSGQEVCPGGTAVFTVSSGDDVTYQWNAVDGPTGTGAIISGSSTPTLTITGVQPGDARSYECTVSADCGAAASTSAQLIVDGTPVISTQPVSTTACQGGNVMLVVQAQGTPAPTFRWQENGVPLNDGRTASGSTISGSSTPTLLISLLQPGDATMYSCAVTNACATTSTNTVTLTLASGVPGVSTQPNSVSTCLAGTATMSVAASAGEPIVYQWQWLPPGSPTLTNITEGVNLNPVTHAAAFTATNSGGAAVSFSKFKNVPSLGMSFAVVCQVSDICGAAASDFASVTICPADFDCSGAVDVSDIFSFLAAWFGHSPSADFNGDGVVSVQDIFSFLAVWFLGC